MSNDFPEAGAPHTVMFAKVREFLARMPFVPFRIRTSSGVAYDVPTADHASTLPVARMIQVGFDDGTSVDLTALHIVALEPMPRRPRRARQVTRRRRAA